MPLWYEGAVKEHLSVRRTSGVFDISHMGRFRLTGPNAASVLTAALSRDFHRLAPEQAIYALACNDNGGIVDDLMVYRPVQAAFLVICNAINAARVHGLLSEAAAGQSITIENVQEQTVLLAVQGPEAVAKVSKILSSNVGSIPRRNCRELVAAAGRYFMGRTGYTGEDGFEVMTSTSAGAELFERLLADGVTPCGLAARDSLRLEAALPLHGADIDESVKPWEAGLGWAVELDHEFRGRDALRSSRDSTARRLACIVSDGEGVFRSHQHIYHGEELIGQVSSGGFSPMLDRSIAMAYLPLHLVVEGMRLAIDIRGRRVDCHTVKRPFYKSPPASSAFRVQGRRS